MTLPQQLDQVKPTFRHPIEDAMDTPHGQAEMQKIVKSVTDIYESKKQ